MSENLLKNYVKLLEQVFSIFLWKNFEGKYFYFDFT